MILYDLTLAQKSLLELMQFYKDTSVSVLCGTAVFDELYNSEKLMEASRLVLRKHQAMRLCFVNRDGCVKQFVNEGIKEPVLKRFDSLDGMREYAQKLAGRPFTTDGSFMYELVVFEAEGKSGIILSASHLISDAWTFSLIANDIVKFYAQLMAGKEVKFTEQIYTARLEKEEEYKSSGRYAEDEAYWLEKYGAGGAGGAGSEKLKIEKNVRGESIEASRLSTFIGRELKEKIDKFTKENRLSISTLFDTAVLIYLNKINPDSSKTTIGVPVLGRTNRLEKETAGVYISTVPLTIDIYGGQSVIDLLRAVYTEHHRIYRHKSFSYSELLKKLRANNENCDGLFDVLVSCQNAKVDINATTEWIHNGYGELPLSIHIDNRDCDDKFTVIYDYQRSCFEDENEVKLLAQRIEYILDQIVTSPNDKAAGISIVPSCERELLIDKMNDTFCEIKDTSVAHVFARVASENPEGTALKFMGRKYTYTELNSMSDMLAWKIHKSGIGPGDIVPIKTHRTPFMIIAMLAVIKTGAAYMFVSPAFPESRIQYMTETVGAKFVLTNEPGSDFAFELSSSEILEYNGFDFVENGLDDPLYVVFTSGSTGKPKGTIVTNGNVLNYCMNHPLNVMGKIIKDKNSGIVSVTESVFDIFVTESILALLNGITIYLASDEEVVSQKKLGALIERENIGIIQTTPTKMRSYILDRSNVGFLRKLHTIILGGEELTSELCTTLQKFTLAEIHNVYGPVETTVWSTVAPRFEGDRTIGTPISNTQIYITDENLNLLPTGVMGEICIGGAGVAKGYIGNDELTSVKFVADPYKPGMRLYRTGDMGIRRADGLIDFCGRKDSQIKLRGLRIELGEIENAMVSFEGIALAAVIAVDVNSNADGVDGVAEKNGAAGKKILAAYYTCASSAPIDERELRAFLATRLPHYMVPNVFTKLDSMPLTASGKISRTKLPAPDLNKVLAGGRREFIAPANEAERLLCGIFETVLHLEKVGATEDFLELGGDSFGAMEVVSLAENAGLEVSVSDIYENRTVREICASVCESADCAEKIKLDEYPLKRRFGGRALLSCFSLFSRAVTKFKVSDIEKIQGRPKAIICPNHESDLDAILVLSTLRRVTDIDKVITFISSERGHGGIEKKIFEVCGGIPINGEGLFMQALTRATNLLTTTKDYLIIFPEGTRSRTGALGAFKNGAAKLSRDTGIPIIPVYLRGTGKAMPVGSKRPKYLNPLTFKKFDLEVVYGEPIDPAGKSIDEITSALRENVVALGREHTASDK